MQRPGFDNHGSNHPVDGPNPSMELIQGDRRNDRRYTAELSLEYRATGAGSRGECGSGKTIDIGRAGICFEGQHDLPVGTMTELSVDWPFLLQNCCPLRLLIAGRVIWSQAGRNALRINRYEFRTYGPRSFQEASPAARKRSFVG
jgi:hypothetical protein